MKISIQNLKQGVSKYSETISPDFVDNDYKWMYPYNFKVDAFLDKIDKDFRLKVNLTSKSKYTCDRCLKEFESDFDLNQEQIYKTASATEIIDDDTIILPLDVIELDLDKLLNDTVVINHPIKMVCKDDCKGLCIKCGTDLNETECQCTDKDIDPRWDKLRRLIK